MNGATSPAKMSSQLQLESQSEESDCRGEGTWAEAWECCCIRGPLPSLEPGALLNKILYKQQQASENCKKKGIQLHKRDNLKYMQ